MRKQRVWAILFLGAAMCNLPVALHARPVVLVKRGKAVSTVVVGKNLPSSEAYAGSELQKYLEKISGGRVPIKENGESVQGTRILLGTMASNEEIKALRGQLPSIQTVGDEGFVIKRIGNNLVIAGGGSSGVLYGAYTFLEKYLGCRWYSVGELGEVVPTRSTVEVGQIEDIEKPSFQYRCMGIFGASGCGKDGHCDPAIVDWMAKNRMNNKKTMTHVVVYSIDLLKSRAITPETSGHSFWWLVPGEEYYDKHPEYYPLVDGKRIRMEGPGTDCQLCLSNPDIVTISVEKVKGLIQQCPGLEIIGISPNDNHTGMGWCECDKCKALGATQTDRLVSFVNTIAAEVRKTYPDKKIGFLAYSDCTGPPTVKPLENVMVDYVRNGRCYKHALNDPNCPTNRIRAAEIKGWLTKVDPSHLAWGDYTDPWDDLPQPTASVVADDLQYLHKMRMRGLMIDSTPGSWEMLKLSHYVTAKMAWNVNLKYKDILNDFCLNYFGPAEPAMKKYFTMLDRAVQDSPGCFGRGDPKQFINILSPSVMAELNGCLNEAVSLVTRGSAKADSTAYLKRIAIERTYFDKWTSTLGDLRRAETAAQSAEVHVLPVSEGLPPVEIKDWEGGVPATNFIEKISQVQARHQTWGWLRYDQQYLYVILKCQEPNLARVTSGTAKDDAPTWGYDDVEVFIDSDNDKNSYYLFGADSAGNHFDMTCSKDPYVQDITWTIQWAARTQKEKDCWYAELRIPLKEINLLPEKGMSFGLSLNRCRYAGDPVEPSGWPNGKFHQPEYFGKAVFK